MEDLLQLAIFAAILLLSLLGGAKKKRAEEQRRGQRRPRPGPRQPQHPTRSPHPGPSPESTEGQRQEGLEAILDLLRGDLPSPPKPEPVPDVRPPPADIDDEARPLETLTPLGDASHRVFHERYIEPDRTPAPVRRSRYRLTPKTAREAVVWTAIFSPPKGYE